MAQTIVPLVIDFSALTSDNAALRSDAIRALLEACQAPGLFTLVNHGISEPMISATLAAAKEFFDLPEGEKDLYITRVSDLILMTYGSHNIAYVTTVMLWMKVLRLFLHPDEFHFPHSPISLRELVTEYSKMNKTVTRVLTKAILEGLELKKEYADETMKLDSSFQIFVANIYPTAPENYPDALRPAHSNPGLFTMILDNKVPGLQMPNDDKEWVLVEANPQAQQQNDILVMVSDQLEIFTNGKFKSRATRTVAHSQNERLEVVMTNGPALETQVRSASELVQRDGRGRFLSSAWSYQDYMELKFRLARGITALLMHAFARIP